MLVSITAGKLHFPCLVLSVCKIYESLVTKLQLLCLEREVINQKLNTDVELTTGSCELSRALNKSGSIYFTVHQTSSNVEHKKKELMLHSSTENPLLRETRLKITGKHDNYVNNVS